MLSNGTDHEGRLEGVDGTVICVNAPVKLYDGIDIIWNQNTTFSLTQWYQLLP